MLMKSARYDCICNGVGEMSCVVVTNNNQKKQKSATIAFHARHTVAIIAVGEGGHIK